jgi:segregation and condensation protein B
MDRLPANHPVPAVYRLLLHDPARETESGELARDTHLAMVEAALMAADEPLPARRLAQAAGLRDGNEARRLVQRLQQLYARDETAFRVEELAGGYQLLSRAVFHPWLARLRRAGAEVRLTPASRETLAIVAYRQPITRADIEAIRGVQSSEVLQQLMEKGLIRIAGRDDSLGRPMLYGTTRKFLQIFGLKSLKELPQAGELTPPKQPRGKESEETAEGE